MRHPANKLWLVLIVAALISGCVKDTSSRPTPTPYSDEWNQYIEATLMTGDGMGHGPDIGSDEWKSVVEFKLGLRADLKMPARSSPDWCLYIDDRISTSSVKTIG